MNINQDILELALSITALVVFLLGVIIFEAYKSWKVEARLKHMASEFKERIAENEELSKKEVEIAYLTTVSRTENRIKNMNSEELYEFLKN